MNSSLDVAPGAVIDSWRPDEKQGGGHIGSVQLAVGMVFWSKELC
jgi:hypothetical protein